MSNNVFDFAELDDLLTQAMTEQQEADRLKLLKKKIFGRNSTETDRESHQREVAALEAKVHWTPIADVVCLRQHICPKCANRTNYFETFLQEQRHKNGRSVRLVHVGLQTDNLPKKTVIHEYEALCTVCLNLDGYPSTGATICHSKALNSPVHHILDQQNSALSVEATSQQLLEELGSLES